MSEWCVQRNRHVANLRALIIRERRWVIEDPDDEDGVEALAALEFAVQRLQGMPEDWVAVVDGVPLPWPID